MRDSIYLIKPKNKPFYQIIYFRNGKKTSKTTKTKRKSEAMKFLSEFKKNLQTKEIIPEIKLSDYREKYLEYMKRGYSKSYLTSIDLSLRKLQEFTGDVYLNKITRAIAEDFITSTYKRTKYGARVFNRNLKAAFNKAMENWKYVEENPFKKIKIPKIPEKLPVFVTEPEFRVILDHTDSQLMKDIFTVAFFTGMRLSEITNLTWSNIDFGNKVVIVKNTETFTTKSKKERIIPMTKEVNSIFHKYDSIKRSVDHPVFYRILGIVLRGDYISKRFRVAVKKADLYRKGIHFHSLRHSFASNLVLKGVPLVIVKELMGHSDISTTLIYSHVRREDLVNAVKKFELDI